MNRISKKGVALLYSVLLITVILSIGLLLMDIVTKQIILSSVGKNSQFANYASNIGVECVEHMERYKIGLFGLLLTDPNDETFVTYIPPAEDPSFPSFGEFNCGGQDFYMFSPTEVIIDTYGSSDVDNDGNIDGRTFSFEIEGNNICTKVTVFKDTAPDKDSNLCAISQGSPTSDCNNSAVVSRGYNASCTDLKDNPNNPRALEREVRKRY